MANQEHVNRLMQGMEIWNKFRRTNPTTSPDLQGADLSGFDFTRVDFNKADLSEADLSNAYLLTERPPSRTRFLSGQTLVAQDSLELYSPVLT